MITGLLIRQDGWSESWMERIESDTINQDFGKRRGSIMKKRKAKEEAGDRSGAVAVVAGGFTQFWEEKKGNQIPQVQVVEAENRRCAAEM